MADLHAIDPVAIAPQVADLTTELVAMVEGGTVAMIAISIVHRDGTTRAMWSEDANATLLVGAISRTLHQVNIGLDDD